MVFHTAPPHPASNARMICSPELVGGAEASQKGFGELMPMKTVLRSAMEYLLGDGPGSPLAVRHRVHDLAAAVHTVSAGKILRIGRAAGGAVHCHGPLLDRDSPRGAQQLQEPRLAQSGYDHVAGEYELGARHRLGISTSRCVRGTERGFHEPDTLRAAVRRNDFHRLSQPVELHCLDLCVVVLEGKCRHLLLCPPVEYVDFLRAQADR